MELTPEQQRAVDAFDDLRLGRRRRLVMGGYAGTGKTTVIRAIVEHYGASNVAVCTPTGKAAHVLRSKGVDAGTLHSLIYTPRVNKWGELSFSTRYLSDKLDLVIVDEASMLSARMVRDLERKAHAVMYVGDHGQLEPISDDPGLMRRLDIELVQIHRQAEGSGIIDFAHHVRHGRNPKAFGVEATVQRGGSADLVDFDVIIVGFNKTRVAVNRWIRKRRGYAGDHPQVGERVICLANNSDWGVWNGMLAKVTKIDTEACRMDVATDDGPRRGVPYDAEQFHRPSTKVLPYGKKRRGPPPVTLWDFGYVLTAHKSQGSEFDRVAVKEEIAGSWDPQRWRYTAATRAAKELRWVLPPVTR